MPARPRASAGLVGNLSPREIDVLRQVAFGRTNRDAAAALFISEETVKTHVARILDKLSLENRQAGGVHGENTAWSGWTSSK